MTLFRVTKADEHRNVKNREGKSISFETTIHLIAPTKKGDEWSNYLGVLCVYRGGKTSFDITHISSSAWGNFSWRIPPFDYKRQDIEQFVLKECADIVQKLQAKLAEENFSSK